MISVAIIQVKDESEFNADKIKRSLSEQGDYKIHWYYYPNAENIEMEIQDLEDFYNVIIVVKNKKIIFYKGKELLPRIEIKS